MENFMLYNLPIPIHFSSLISKMSIFTLYLLTVSKTPIEEME